MALVSAPPSQGFTAELGSLVKFQRQGEAVLGHSCPSVPFSSRFKCAGLWKYQRECWEGNSGVSRRQESLRVVSFNFDRRHDVSGARISRTVASENFEGGAFPAGFWRTLSGKIATTGSRQAPATLVRVSERSESPLEQDDIWAKSSLPPYFKQYARPPKEKLNWALIAGGLLFVVVMRKAIILEMTRWVLGSVTALGYITKASTVALAWLVDAYGQHLGIVLTLVGWAGLAFQDAYAFVIDMTPVGALLSAAAWVSAVLSVGDVASTTAREGSGVFMVAGLLGLFAVLGSLPPSLLLLGLILLIPIQLFVRKTDMVAAVMPMTAVLAAVGDPVVKIIAFALFLSLSIRSYWKSRHGRQEEKPAPAKGKQPLLLVILMAFVGISVAANTLHALHMKWLVG